MKKISVIIPSYNNGRFLDKCLQSIITQKTYEKFEKEYIIVDNCSTDNTDQIVDRYHRRNLLYVKEKDKGIMDVWNKGFKISTGDYIAFCNVSDYYYHEDWFNNCIEIMENKNWVSAVYGLTLIIDEVDYKFHGVGGERILPIFNNGQTPEQCLAAFINQKITWNECTAVLKREAIESLYPFAIHDFGSTLDGMRRFYEDGYLSYFIRQIGAITLIHHDSGTNNHQSKEEANSMWDIHYKKISNFKDKLVKGGVHNFRNNKNNILGSIIIKGENGNK